MADSILERWDITTEDLTKVIDRNPSLRGMIIGYLAEMKLEQLWLSGKGISHVGKHDDHDRKKKGDRIVVYKEHTDYQRRHLLATLVNVSWPPQPPFLEEPFTLMNEIIQNRI